MVVCVFVELCSLTVAENDAAHFLDFCGGHIPELSGAQFGITELLDQ